MGTWSQELLALGQLSYHLLGCVMPLFHLCCPPCPILGHRTRTTGGSVHGDLVTRASRPRPAFVSPARGCDAVVSSVLSSLPHLGASDSHNGWISSWGPGHKSFSPSASFRITCSGV